MQAVNVQAAHSGISVFNAPPGSATLVNLSDIILRHLVGPAEISSVAHLRGEIDLSAHAANGPTEFARLEKKETNWGSSSASTSKVSGLAPFGSSQWAIASP
jgi:hypothetical protein